MKLPIIIVAVHLAVEGQHHFQNLLTDDEWVCLSTVT
jgi:hypothetical protein